ncbi:hypothetical protein ACFQZ4_50230 [Catellatospora coxensis]
MVGTFIRNGWQGTDRARQGRSGQRCGVLRRHTAPVKFRIQVDLRRGSPLGAACRTRRLVADGHALERGVAPGRRLPKEST